MAMRACSLNRSPAPLSVPLYYSAPSKPSVQIPQPHSPSPPPSSSSSSSFSITKNVSNVLVSDDSLTIAAIVEAVSLANAAAEAAKDAVSSALALSKVGHEQLRNGEGDEGIDARESGMAARRRRRMMKKRRKDMEFYDDDADSGRCLVEGCSSRSERSRYLTRRQEAEFSLYLKEGCIGLLQGAQRFDYKRGYKLSTYVYWWIKQAMIKAIANKSSIIRLPGSLCGVTAKVIEAKSLLRSQLGRWPTYEEIADFVNLGVPSVQLVSERSRHPVSADRSVNEEGMALKDIIPGPDEIRPEVIVNRQLMIHNIEKLLKTLSEREEYIVRLHYGLNGETARSCDEIGRLLNLSRERIRQIHCTALTRLREEKNMIECFAQIVV